MAASVIPLSLNESAATGFTHKIVATYADFVAAATSTATTSTLTPVTVVAGSLVRGNVAIHVVTDFVNSETAVTGVGLEVGDGSDVDRFLTSKVVGEGSVATWATTANVTDTLPYVYTTSDTVDLKLTVSGGSSNYVSTLTAGEVHVFLSIAEIAKLDQ